MQTWSSTASSRPFADQISAGELLNSFPVHALPPPRLAPRHVAHGSPPETVGMDLILEMSDPKDLDDSDYVDSGE